MGGGTVLRFFSGKMDQEMAVFWSKTELLGQFYVFSFCQTTKYDYKQLEELGWGQYVNERVCAQR